MRWIEGETEYREARDRARVCVDVDSGRRPTENAMLYFCDLDGMTERFPPLLNDLLLMSRDRSCVHMVLDPDPEYFWHDRLGAYPVFEFTCGDRWGDYKKFLNRSFGSSRGDNMMDIWYSYVIFPPSQKWFVYTIRSERDDTGHLWIPAQWAKEITSLYPFVRDKPSLEEAPRSPREL